MKPKGSVEAWASVWPDGVMKVHGEKVCADAYSAPHVRTVKLVESDPARDAVVRAAMRVRKADAHDERTQDDDAGRDATRRFDAAIDDLLAAVEKLQQKGRKR